MWQQLWNYCTQPVVLTILTFVSIGIFVIGFVLIPPLAVKLPADHFVRQEEAAARRSLRDWVWYVCRNLFALVLLVAGVAMILLPGPGIITIIVAVALADFPGKRRVERAFIRTWIVRTALNAMRNKYGAPPMIIPDVNGNPEPPKDETSNQSLVTSDDPDEAAQLREK
jgi:MFS family permease